MNWINTNSSSINRFAYDDTTKTLAIEFNQGEIYTYANVPADVVAGLVSADSKGSYVNDFIAYAFTYTKVKK